MPRILASSQLEDHRHASASGARTAILAVAVAMVIVLVPRDALAYVGPGAGMAFATAAFALLASIVVVTFGLLLYPVRWTWRWIRRRRPPRTPRVRRAVVIGLDGLDPVLTRRFMDRGLLPNLERLGRVGCFHQLRTTNPPMSPVAWSSFATGVLPGKHGIFDFLTRDPRTYLPDLSSAEVRPARRHLELGPYRIPLGRPTVRMMRRSRPFWTDLGRHGVPSSILRVPITFPPDRFEGSMLSAMCVPDLEGTQGTFTVYSSSEIDRHLEGGRRIALEVRDARAEAWIEGPANPIRRDGRRTRLPLRLELDRERRCARASIDGEQVELRLGEYTDWIALRFPLGLGLRMRGICRFRLVELGDDVRIYQTPIQIDPESPILPISHPPFFATFLAKLCGRYATLGLAEDTWALNEGVLDEHAFLEQAWANHAEREAQLFAMLRRTRRGLVACVFDSSDRIQHMFTRHIDRDHPANASAGDSGDKFSTVIEDTYRKLDELVGRVLAQVDPSDRENFVAVISDHGFQTFRRGVNLNAWLREHGYLHLEPGREHAGEWFDGIDWTRTRAYALGLGGIYLNIAGREAKGIVSADDAPALADEIAAKLSTIVDPGSGESAIRKCYPAHQVRGPYADQSPDVIVGYRAGWRISWEGARGIADGPVFLDNTKAWSGDHCIDPDLVPGVLIANRSLALPHDHVRAEEGPHIIDLAPTLLELFGVIPPRHMDGSSLVAS
ncbi:MAG: alkaline phosphatase family protein [Kofleriaceae bacterium]